MISEIRSYIKSQIASADPNLKENKSAFFYNDIGETLIDRSYQIEINNVTSTLRTDYREDSLDVVVNIFGYGYRDEITRYDELLDKAICIRDNIIDLKNFTGQSFIVDASADDIISEQLDGDDNGFKININFTLAIAYTREN